MLVIAIAVAILIVRFILWLLPIILIIFLSYFIYNRLIRRNKKENKSKIIIIEHKNKR